MTKQTLNILAAALGALSGLALAPQLSNEAVPAAVTAVLLIACLGKVRLSRIATLALCCVLGLACTRLTVSLVS